MERRNANRAGELYQLLREACAKHKIRLEVPKFTPTKIRKQDRQMKMF